MVQKTITITEARKQLGNKNLSNQEIEGILAKLYGLCERVINKTVKERYGK